MRSADAPWRQKAVTKSQPTSDEEAVSVAIQCTSRRTTIAGTPKARERTRRLFGLRGELREAAVARSIAEFRDTKNVPTATRVVARVLTQPSFEVDAALLRPSPTSQGSDVIWLRGGDQVRNYRFLRSLGREMDAFDSFSAAVHHAANAEDDSVHWVLPVRTALFASEHATIAVLEAYQAADTRGMTASLHFVDPLPSAPFGCLLQVVQLFEALGLGAVINAETAWPSWLPEMRLDATLETPKCRGSRKIYRPASCARLGWSYLWDTADAERCGLHGLVRWELTMPTTRSGQRPTTV